jgi:hydrogenase-4 component F
MELIALIVVPFILACMAYAMPHGQWSRRVRPWLLPVAGTVNIILTFKIIGQPSVVAIKDWIELDPLGRVVLLVLSVLFFGCFLYVPHYLRLRSDRRNRVFCTCLLFMFSMVSLSACANHFGLMWVALEATTLCTAPLLYFNQTAVALEAAWKYILICSLGIALALLGTFFLAYSSLHVVGLDHHLTATLFWNELRSSAPVLSKPWLHAAFVTLLVGYGTKLGLAPMHTWKPDAYGEAPGVVGALLSGGVTSCAFLVIARGVSLMHLAGEFEFARNLLLVLGLFSMLVAAVFMIRQQDFKRMLAYSSVEHMGILVIGLGLGGLGSFAAFYHLMNNAFTKGIVFLAAGNIHFAYGSKSIEEVKGALTRIPISASMLLIGFIAIVGSPPFAPFMSEFTLLRAAFSTQHYLVGVLALIFLMIVFFGMGTTVLSIVYGTPPEKYGKERLKEGLFGVLPMFFFLVLIIVLGVYLPTAVKDMLSGAVDFLEKQS